MDAGKITSQIIPTLPVLHCVRVHHAAPYTVRIKPAFRVMYVYTLQDQAMGHISGPGNGSPSATNVVLVLGVVVVIRFSIP